MHHYFIENEDIESIDENVFNIKFNDIDISHVKAQRLKCGEHITVVDKSGNYFELELVNIDKNGVQAKIACKKDFSDTSFDITLFQGVSKNTKLDDVLRATTEIGITQFYAVNMQRSVAVIKTSAKNKKLDRFKTIARSASMQSGRSDIPSVKIIGDVVTLKEMIDDFDVFIIFWEKSSQSDTIEKALEPFDEIKKVGILIGPEGGISDEEIQILTSFENCRICNLGSTILRTETAGIVSVAIVKHVLESIS